MKRILFTNAVDPYSEIENRYRPLWAGYLSAYLNKHLGNNYFEYKFMNKGLEKEIESFKPDLVAIGSVTQNFSNAINYAQICKDSGIPVVVGGMHISFLPGSFTKNMDVGCIGEGEETFLELMSLFLAKGKFEAGDLKNIDGIVYNDHGRLITTKERRTIGNLDSIPHPKRDLLGYGHRAYVISSRGCPYKCVFCACTRFWGKVRYCSAEYIMEEIDELVQNGVKVIRFNDDNFPANPKLLRKIADMIVERGYNRQIKFSCWGRANNITSEVAEAFKDMNMVSVVMGLESGNQRVLDYLKGHVSVEQNARAIDLLRDAGIQANADFLIGSPDESFEEIMETYEFIKKSRVSQVAVNILSPLPGTPIWDYAINKGLIPDNIDWDQFNFDFKFDPEKDSNIILSEKLTHDEMRLVHKKFKRLERIKTFKALPQSPWLDELPRLILNKIKEKAAKFLSAI